MKKTNWLLRTIVLGAVLVGPILEAKATLTSAGDLAFTSFNTDTGSSTAKSFAFVTLKNISAGETVYFTDNEWDGSALNTGEGFLTWTTGALTAGSVITISGYNIAGVTASSGTVVRGSNFDFSNSDDGILAYLGSSTTAPTTFLTGISNDTLVNAGISLSGTGLTSGTNFIAIAGDEDVGKYTGARNNQTSFSAYSAQINSATWTTDDGSGDQGATVTPFDTTAFTLASTDTSVLTIGGLKTATVNLGRVVDNAFGVSSSVTVDNTGPELGNFTASATTGGTVSPASGTIASSSGQSFTVGLAQASGSNITNGTGGVDVSKTVTIDNTGNPSDGDITVTVNARVVENRFINSGSSSTPATNDFGSVIVGQSKTQNINLVTTNTNASLTNNDLTAITIPASPAATIAGATLASQLASASIAPDSSTVVNDGSITVTRSLTLSPSVAGSVSTDASNYVRFTTTPEGLPGETIDPHSRIYFQFTGLTSANSSFAASDMNSLTIDLGSFTQGTGTQTPGFNFDLFNLLTTAGFTAGLDLTGSLSGLGDSELLISLLGSVDNLGEAAMTNVLGTASVDTNTAPGLLSRDFTLQLRDDENIGGFQAQTLTLTLQANILPVPEPSALGLLAIGLLGIAGFRRRR